MGYLILYITLIAGAVMIEKRKPEGIKTRMGWLKPDRCSDCGVTRPGATLSTLRICRMVRKSRI